MDSPGVNQSFKLPVEKGLARIIREGADFAGSAVSSDSQRGQGVRVPT